MTQMSHQDTVPFVAQCTRTGETIETTTANEVVAFYRRQQRLMDTDVEWVVADHDAISPELDADSVESALRELDDEFEDGIPIGILTAAMSNEGKTVGETLTDLYELRMSGSIWEPRSDHLRPV
jgi:hypothetical protein